MNFYQMVIVSTFRPITFPANRLETRLLMDPITVRRIWMGRRRNISLTII